MKKKRLTKKELEELLKETYNIRNGYPEDHPERIRIDHFIQKTKEKIGKEK